MTDRESGCVQARLGDPTEMQISVPIQRGASGGPVLDQAGNVIGVVVSKLDALKLAERYGDLPVAASSQPSVPARVLLSRDGRRSGRRLPQAPHPHRHRRPVACNLGAAQGRGLG